MTIFVWLTLQRFMLWLKSSRRMFVNLNNYNCTLFNVIVLHTRVLLYLLLFNYNCIKYIHIPTFIFVIYLHNKRNNVLQDLHSSAWYLYMASNRAFGFWLDLICLIYLTIVTFGLIAFTDNGKLDGAFTREREYTIL